MTGGEYRRGVGLVLFNTDGLVFAGRRIDMQGDVWQMPQGGIDEDEAPSDAALRELREETGIDKAVVVAESAGWLSYDLPAEIRERVWGGQFRGQTQKWFVLRFTGTDADIDLDAAEPEFDAWRWMALDQLALQIVDFKRRLYADLAAEFGDLIAREMRGR